MVAAPTVEPGLKGFGTPECRTAREDALEVIEAQSKLFTALEIVQKALERFLPFLSVRVRLGLQPQDGDAGTYSSGFAKLTR